MGYDFTQAQCIKALLKIGFTNASKRGGKHYKYKPPKECELNFVGNIRPFITVPKHKFYCQNEIVDEIRKLCGDELKQEFLNNL